MKNTAIFGVLFFIMTLLAKDITAIGVQIWYRVNITYVAKNLCENKDKPEMKCNGKCHLAKQLAKTEGNKSEKGKSELPVLKLKAIEALIDLSEGFVIAKNYEQSENHYFSYHNIPTSGFSDTEERPPCA